MSALTFAATVGGVLLCVVIVLVVFVLLGSKVGKWMAAHSVPGDDLAEVGGLVIALVVIATGVAYVYARTVVGL